MRVCLVSTWLFLSSLFGLGHCCLDGWFKYGIDCYKIEQEKDFYLLAKVRCLQDGGNVIPEPTAEIAQFLQSHLEENSDGFWIKKDFRLFVPPDGDCYIWTKEGIQPASCYDEWPYACVRSDEPSICNFQPTIVEHFHGEGTGRCIFQSPVHILFSERDSYCENNGGRFLDLPEILHEGLNYLHDKKVFTNDNIKYWTEMKSNGSQLLWSNGEAVPTELIVNNGTGDCVTVMFNFTDKLEFHLFQMNCSGFANVICSKNEPKTETSVLETTIDPETLECPSGYNWRDGRNGYCYWETSFEYSRLSWDRARNFCKSFEGDLVSFHSRQEEKTGLHYQYGSLSHFFWIGLRYNITTNNYTWSDGSPLDYQNWAPYHPNTMNKTLLCVAISGETKVWESKLCGLLSWVICKAPKTAHPVTAHLPTQQPIQSCTNGAGIRDTHSFFNGFCYFVQKREYNWHRAQEYCNNMGSTLTSIHDVDELGFLLRLLYENEVTGSTRVWTGLNSLSNFDDALQWSDGTPVDFSFWSDDWRVNPKTEKCINMNASSGRWTSDNCNAELAFICRKKDGIVETTAVPPTTPKSVSGNCKKGWLAHEDRCYLVAGEKIKNRLNWTQAKNECESLGSYLTSIRSHKDQVFLTYLLQEIKEDVWIGLYDFRAYGSYYWVDNSHLKYTNWAPGQPSSIGIKEDCVKMVHNHRKSGVWKDDICDQKLPYICQMPKNPKLPNPGYQKSTRCLHPPDWLRLDAQCLEMFSGNPMTWAEAEKTCRRFGAHLVSITQSSVQTAAEFLGTEVNNSFWIGLQYEETKQKFSWLNKGPMAISRWGSKEPSLMTKDGVTYDSPCFSSDADGHWSKTNCSQTMPFICQISTDKFSLPKRFTGSCTNTSDLWTPTDGSYCFIIDDESEIDWYSANHGCFLYGSNLISFHSLEDVQSLKKSLPSNIQSFYIGLSRSGPGGFSWTDYSPVDFVNWDSGQPDKDEHHCVIAFGEDLKWKVVDCESQFHFMCASRKVNEETLPEPDALVSDSAVASLVPGITTAVAIILCVLVAVFLFLHRDRLIACTKFGSTRRQEQTMSFENALYKVETTSMEFKKETDQI